MQHQQFTLEEANDLVPWLEATFQRLAPARDELASLQSNLSRLRQQARGNGSSSQHEEMSRVQEQVTRLAQRVEEGMREILERGIIVRDIERGLVDFPSQREGREVYLCWISGEERIEFWHDTDRGFAHRQPL